ncbi:MAG: heparinase II/III-family protein [Lachnospiraceae bacterium]|nr:heparinase II/III-family protein [Lachnospiraceae bacterium]
MTIRKEFTNILNGYSGKYICPDFSGDLGILLNNISDNAKRELKKAADDRLSFEYGSLAASLFMSFKRTGNRTDYEDIYFEKRRALNDLILGELCTQEEDRYMGMIIDGIFSICEESTWCLPAHNTYIRDTPQLILPDTQRPVIDLFACETAALLSAAGYLLKERLDAISPFITKRIQHEIRTRIIKPYLSTHFWWMGRGMEPMCNWTIWCTQNILITAALNPLSETETKKLIKKAALSVDLFLKDYGQDGCCDEGAGYYRHAGLCLYITISLLNRFTNNAFMSMWQDEKIRNIAEYICNVHADGIYYLNYSDCSAVPGRSGVREYLFGKAVGSKKLMRFAAEEYRASDDPYMKGEINLTYRLLTLMTEKEILKYDADVHHETGSKETVPQCIWYESTGLFIVKTDDTVVSIKAGDNDDNHNHNDTGSLILYHKGRPVLIDVGVESYSAKTFSDRRYEIWTMQSSYHNLPTINGFDEMAGKDFKAKKVKINRDDLSLSMDIAAAFPKECNISSYIRHLSANREGSCLRIKLSDTAKFKKPVSEGNTASEDVNGVILNFMTYEKPTFKNNILKIGDIYAFRVSGVSDCNVETIPITDKRLSETWKHDIYRVGFTMEKNRFLMETCNL